MESLTFVDTNVWVYLHDNSEPVKQKQAREVLRGLTQPIVSGQVLAEFHAVASRKMRPPLDDDVIAGALRDLAELTVQPITAGLVIESARIRLAHQLSPWDALIIAAASAAGCDRILTEDLADGSTLAGVRIENPFRPG